MGYLNPPPLETCYTRLQDKVIFITGASSGIGAAAAELFAREGAKVVAAARRTERVEDAMSKLRAEGLQAAAVACDVCNEVSVENAVRFASEHFGRLDGAFNCAGVSGARMPIHTAQVKEFDRVMQTNLRGVFLCLKHEAATMLQSGGGSIVNASSIAGMISAAGNSIYATSKWGLTALTRCAALDYARDGIRVNAIAPGPTRSEMFDAWKPSEEDREQLAEAFPMNYVAHPQDMARAALFLLSDESRWTTGAILPCEGGRSAV